MEFPKELITGPEANSLYKKLEALKEELNVKPCCGTLFKIKMATKELCAATGVPYPKKEWRI